MEHQEGSYEDTPLNDYVEDVHEFTKEDVDGSSNWKIDSILNHRDISPLKTELQIKWDSGETTWVPLYPSLSGQNLNYLQTTLYQQKENGPIIIGRRGVNTSHN